MLQLSLPTFWRATEGNEYNIITSVERVDLVILTRNEEVGTQSRQQADCGIPIENNCICTCFCVTHVYKEAEPQSCSNHQLACFDSPLQTLLVELVFWGACIRCFQSGSKNSRELNFCLPSKKFYLLVMAHLPTWSSHRDLRCDICSGINLLDNC